MCVRSNKGLLVVHFLYAQLSLAPANERQLKHHMFSIKNCVKLNDNNEQSRENCMGMGTGLLVKTNAQPAHVI